ncbi:transaldolase [Streptomyces sp. NPDC101151]|uniref:transaldolase n=1 Tax=Streptomyces sp. NPDC101151 TaxID=3366115 RepID=UPI0037F6774C
MTDVLTRMRHEGVSVWLDDTGAGPGGRGTIGPDSLRPMIEAGHVVGVTSHPTLLAEAHRHEATYRARLRGLTARERTPETVVRWVAAEDIRRECDLLLPVHHRTAGRDGFVSVELDPAHAHDTRSIVREARLVRSLIDRPNVLVQIPATAAGTRALTVCVGEGIGVDATLVFSPDRHRQVLEAYLAGLEAAEAQGRAVSDIVSVASFSVDAFDSVVDAELAKAGTPEAKAFVGRAGLANARLAYEVFQDVTASSRWRRLARKGARTQRLMWVSTGACRPDRRDTLYIEELIARDTVSTMPACTLDALAGHGRIVGDRVRGHYADSRRILAYLRWFDIFPEAVAHQLEEEGLRRMRASWRATLTEVRRDIRDRWVPADERRTGPAPAVPAQNLMRSSSAQSHFLGHARVRGE